MHWLDCRVHTLFRKMPYKAVEQNPQQHKSPFCCRCGSLADFVAWKPTMAAAATAKLPRNSRRLPISCARRQAQAGCNANRKGLTLCGMQQRYTWQA